MNDTNKNEPCSVFESLQNTYNPDTKLFDRQWTVEEGIWVLVEIERLREEVKTITATKEMMYAKLEETPPRCGSCPSWDKANKWCLILSDNDLAWEGNDYCSKHPDWKEPGKEEG